MLLNGRVVTIAHTDTDEVIESFPLERQLRMKNPLLQIDRGLTGAESTACETKRLTFRTRPR